MGANLAKRPAFRQMLTDLREGTVQADVIVTHSLDRYACNMVVALTTLAEMHQRGVTYSSVTESDFDYSNPDKRLHLSILAMFAAYFSEKLSQHTKKGKKERAAHGLYNGRLSYGYRNPDHGTPASGNGIYNSTVPLIDEDEAAHVRFAYETYASGTASDMDIAKLLNSCGARTRNTFADGARAWSKDSVTALLTNPFYAGWVTYTGQGTNRAADAERVPGRHEPIISQELYDTVQAIRKARTRHATHPSRQKQDYMLAGLLVCANCATPSLLRVQGQTRGTLLAPDWKERALAAAGADADRAALEAERERLQNRLAKIKRLTRDEIMTEEEYHREKTELTDRLARLALPVEVDLDSAADLLAALKGIWAHPATSPANKADVCRRLFAAIVYDTDKQQVKEIHLREELGPLFAVLPEKVYIKGGSDGIRLPVTYAA